MTNMLETIERPLAEKLDGRARKWIELIAEALQEGDDAVFEYDPVSRIEEIEHEERSGFIPWTNGGYAVTLPASLYHAWSSGSAPAPVVPIIQAGEEILADEWACQFPERPPLVDCICADDNDSAAQWRDTAQEWEMEGWQSDDDCYYWKARIIYYAENNRDNISGKPEVYLDAYLCSDSYGRDYISWLPFTGGGKADRTSGAFKLQMEADKFAKISDAQIKRIVKTALRKLPPFVGI